MHTENKGLQTGESQDLDVSESPRKHSKRFDRKIKLVIGVRNHAVH